MRIKEGQAAVEFEAIDMTRRIRRLSDYHGQRLLLCFFRYAA